MTTEEAIYDLTKNPGADAALIDYIVKAVKYEGPNSVAEYNDAPKTTKRDILRVITRAKRELKKDGLLAE